MKRDYKNKWPLTTREKGNARGMVPSSAKGIEDKEYGAYLQKLDPVSNADVRYALAAAPDVRFQHFLRKISGKSRYSLQTHAKICGIGLQEFNDWWGKASTQRAIATFQSAAPKIAAAMSVDAESRMGCCPRCDGLGFVPAEEGLPMETPGYRILRVKTSRTRDDDGRVSEEDIPVWIRSCPEGCVQGRVRKPGDEFSREKLLEAAGLINKKGPGLMLVQNFSGQAMPSAVPRLAESMTIDIGDD